MQSADAMDEVFKALGDPTRRRVIERLGKSPASASELAAPFDMAFQSFSEHLKMLEDAGLVTSRKKGRVRTYTLAPKRMKLAEDWLSRQRSLWEQRLDQLDDYLMKLKKKRS